MKKPRFLSFSYYGVSDDISRKSYISSMVMILVMVVGIGALYRFLPAKIPLYFNEPWGEDRLGAKYMLFLVPAVGLFSLIVDLLLGRKLQKSSDVIGVVLSVSLVSVNIMLILGLVGIIRSIL